MPDPTSDATPTPESRRLSFGDTAPDYDRFRPGYPADAVRWVVGPAPLRVVDLGAGTGLLAEVVAGLGHQVTAVEPDSAMRRQLAERAGATVTVVGGSAEDIPLDDGAADAIVVGQAFHWFDLELALPEMARVLADKGRLGVLWNVRDDDVDWVEQISAMVGRYDARSGNRDADVPAIAPAFTDVQRAEFRHEQPMDPDALVGLVSTFSYVALSPDRDAVLAQVRALASEHPDLAGRRRFGLPYETVVYRATKA